MDDLIATRRNGHIKTAASIDEPSRHNASPSNDGDLHFNGKIYLFVQCVGYGEPRLIGKQKERATFCDSGIKKY